MQTITQQSSVTPRVPPRNPLTHPAVGDVIRWGQRTVRVERIIGDQLWYVVRAAQNHGKPGRIGKQCQVRDFVTCMTIARDVEVFSAAA